MHGILQELTDDKVWLEFLQYKIDKHHLSKKAEKELTDFINNKEYSVVTERILCNDYTFGPPTKRSINKSGTTKKRVIYTFNKAESMTLKVMAFLLYRYDSKISDNCYSFRRNSSAKDAIKNVLAVKNLDKMYCLKVDISNYFNSIPADRLCEILGQVIDDDVLLYEFLKRLLMANEAIEFSENVEDNEHGVIVHENRGAMAGIPISPFFANIYLRELDFYYSDKGISYFRYSDDIVMFFSSMEELENEYINLVQSLQSLGLSVNPDKMHISKPGETWEFLGVCYKNGDVDLSDITKDKLKAKIRRKARSLYRWRVRCGASFEQTAKVLIRVFNKKFYDESDENAFTWSRWFFPVLTTDKSLREIDAYFLQYIRFLYKGRHYKGNYRIGYDDIKELGYRSLVNEYYKGK